MEVSHLGSILLKGVAQPLAGALRVEGQGAGFGQRLHTMRQAPRHAPHASDAGLCAVVALAPTQLAARTFPKGLPGSKARLLARPQGLLCRVSIPTAQDALQAPQPC